MDPQLLALSLYVLVQLGIGIVVSRRIATEDDYFVAGRRMGPFLATFTLFATWFGAETCVGAASEVYAGGVSLASAEPFAYGLCLVLMGAIFAVPLWRRRLTTLADLFRQRFSPGVERFAALVMIPTSVLWAAAQIRAFGQVLGAASELEVDLAITIAAAVVVVYTVAGGLLADAVTDLVQGIALIVGLVVLLVAVVGSQGGLASSWSSIDVARFRWLPEDLSWIDMLEAWAIPICGSVVAQELVARVVASRTPQVARRSSIFAGGAYIAIGLVPVYLGLLGSNLLPGLEDGEQILPRLAAEHLAPFFCIVFAGALVSAILSTVDSTLLVSSSLLSHNVILPLRPRMDERSKVRIARLCVAGFGVIACGLALQAERVWELVEQSSAFGSSGILVIVVFGLFTSIGGARSAYLAVAVGLGVYLAGSELEMPGAYVASLGAALLAYLLGALRWR